jgi:hypothetical protein
MTNTDFTADVLNASATDALTVLAATARPETLIDAWVNAANAAAVQEIAECGAGSARKAARRALNVLKARGVKVPAPLRRVKLAETADAPLSAWLLPPDGAGFLLLAVTRPLPGGACRAVIVTLNDQLGILRVENVETTPSKLAHSLAQVLPGSGLAAVSVPAEWAQYKIAQARAVHAQHKTPEPLGLTSAKNLLEPLTDAVPEHPFDAEGFVLAPEDALDLATGSGALHHLPEFRSWLPPQQSLDALLADVGRQLDPESPPGQEQVSEYIRAAMLDATDRHFTSVVRTAVASRMRDAAVSVFAREDETTALKLAATIQVVSSEATAARDVPFLAAFFEKAVGVMMAQTGGKLNIPLGRRAAGASATV